ncbi:unnamed protein product [Eretmochelys imbricata]
MSCRELLQTPTTGLCLTEFLTGDSRLPDKPRERTTLVGSQPFESPGDPGSFNEGERVRSSPDYSNSSPASQRQISESQSDPAYDHTALCTCFFSLHPPGGRAKETCWKRQKQSVETAAIFSGQRTYILHIFGDFLIAV